MSPGSAGAAFVALALSLMGCSDTARPSAGAAMSGAGTGVSAAAGTGAGMAPAGMGGAGAGGAGGVAGGTPTPAVCTVPDDLAPMVGNAEDDAGTAADCNPKMIVVNNCIAGTCHHTPNRFQAGAAMLDLMSPCIADRLVNVPSKTCSGRPLIDLQHVENSFLLNKLEAELPACGQPMPLGEHLPIAQQRCMRAWVEAVVKAWPRR